MSSTERHTAAPRGSPDRRPRRNVGVQAYTACLVFAAVALVVIALGRARVWPIDPVTFIVLLALGWLSMTLRELETGDQSSISFTSVVIITASPLVGPAAAGVLGALAPLLERRRAPLIVKTFNSALTSGLATLSGLAYVFSGGMLPIQPAHPQVLLLQVGLPLVVANIVLCLSNVGVLAVMVYITGGEGRRFLTGAVRDTLPLYLGYTVICFIFLVLWVPAGVGPVSAALIMAPLLVARWIYAQYGDEVRSHNRILDTLVTASDSVDRVGTGHGRRVDALCDLIAGQLGLSARQSRSLHYAAALHDIGRLGLPPSTLTKPAAEADDEDLAAIRRHPVVAQQILQDIAFLEEAATAIRHHHERVDGDGYPDGLGGDRIPLLARIVAVADAFDALTTPLGRRPALSPADAMALLERRTGRHFDEAVVSALSAALADSPWQPEPDGPREHVAEGLWRDHDDPAVSELLAYHHRTSRECG